MLTFLPIENDYNLHDIANIFSIYVNTVYNHYTTITKFFNRYNIQNNCNIFVHNDEYQIFYYVLQKNVSII